MFSFIFYLQVYLIFLRIVSIELKELSLSPISSNNKTNMTNLLDENVNLKTALKLSEKKRKEKITNSNLNKEVNENENKNKNEKSYSNLIVFSIEKELLIQIIEIITNLSLFSILQLPHIMDLLSILGETNTKITSQFLQRLFEILELQNKEGTYVSTETSSEKNSENANISTVSTVSTYQSTFPLNSVFGIQLEKTITEIDKITKQVYSELNKIFKLLTGNEKIDRDKINENNEKSGNNNGNNGQNGNNGKSGNNLKIVDLSASKLLKHPNIEEKNRIEKRIENLQNKSKNNLKEDKDKNKKSLQFELISDNIIDKLLDLGLFYMDIVYSLSIFFQTSATTQINMTENGNKNSNKNENLNKNDSKIVTKNILSLSILFSNFDFSTAGLFLSENTGKSVILVFQFLYEEVRRRFCTFFFVNANIDFDFNFNSII